MQCIRRPGKGGETPGVFNRFSYTTVYLLGSDIQDNLCKLEYKGVLKLDSVELDQKAVAVTSLEGLDTSTSEVR